MTPSERARVGLSRKQQALKDVVQPWLNQDHVNPRFPRMTSQTKAAINLLNGLIARIDNDIKAAAIQPGPVESRILGAYQFWNVFRLKFTQRLQPELEPFLKAADELAWLCYKPARDSAIDAGDPRCKEPPLVYFSGEASPFVDSRNARFHPEGIPSILLQSYGWPDAATRLPFSLIGVPWFQSGFLPGALAIAHEVGHAVESDFGLGPILQELTDTALGSSIARQSYWKRWTGEMFADLWGCLALGPSFASALAELLGSRYQPDASQILSSEYPPPPLRVWWNCKVLEANGFEASVRELWPHSTDRVFEQPFLDDAERIAGVWLEANFSGLGERKLPGVLNFTSQQQANATAQAETARKRKADQSSDVRALWAAVQFAWNREPTEIILSRIVAACDSAVRERKPIVVANEGRAKYVHALGYEIL